MVLKDDKESIYATDNIAVLMATYNGSRYLKQQIESLLKQSEKEWQLFIHDDGSNDETAVLIDEFLRDNPGKIIKVKGAPTGGAKQNFMYLLKHVDAPYIMFCDQDDIWDSDKIKITFQRMRSLEEDYGTETPILVFTDLRVTDEKMNVIAERMSRYQKMDLEKTNIEEFLAENVVTGCTVMINKRLAELTKEAKDYTQIIMHDWWIALIASKFGVVSCVKEPLISYRQHGDNTIGAKRVGLKYICDKINNQSEVIRALEATRKQAAYFSEVYGLTANDICTRYGRVGEENKLARIAFYRKYGIRKSSFAKNIGMMIWG